MTLHFADVSSFQAGINVRKLGVDAIMAKATGGAVYVNPYCDRQVSQIDLGAVYHFAHDAGSAGTPAQEADHFLLNTKGYIGSKILALDFEAADLINHSSGVAWAHEWLTRVHQETGVKPWLYMPGWVYGAYDWSPVVADDFGAWPAYWPTRPSGFNPGPLPKIKYWPVLAAWQFTDSGRLPGWNGNLDLDLFFGDKAAWQAYAAVGGKPAPAPAPAPVPVPAPAPAPTPPPNQEFIDVSDFTAHTRTIDQVWNPKDDRLVRIDDKGNVSLGFGGGKYFITMRFAINGLATGQDFRVFFYTVDLDSNGKQVGKLTEYPTVGLNGSAGTSWPQVVFDHDIQPPKDGLSRRLRVRCEYSGKKPITVTSVNTTVRKAPLS